MNIDTEAANKLLNYLNGASDIVAEQVPDIINEILVWNTVKYGIIFLMGCSVLFLCVNMFFKIKNKNTFAELFCDEFIIQAYISSVGVLSSCVIVIDSLLNLLQILIAPKLFLIQYISHFI